MKNFYITFKRLLTLGISILLGLASHATDTNKPNNTKSNALVASFTVNAERQCLDNNYFILTNNSSSGTGITYFWDFGDGTSSSEMNPIKVYPRTGNFRIHLEVRNGNDYRFVEKFIDVKPKPVVDFNILTQTLDGHAFTFISSSKIENGAMNYFWDLGDGNTSTSINPTHNYVEEGSTHTVKLVVTSEIGCGDSITKVINYRPETKCALPNASFAMVGNFQCNPKNNIFQFNNLSSIDQGTESFAWTFGDGNTSTETNPSKHYVEKGVYTISLKATNNSINTCNTTIIKTVKLSGVKSSFSNNPVAPQCLNGNRTTFNNATNSDYDRMNYTWVFGDGAYSTQANTTHSYNAAGVFSARLISSALGLTCIDTSDAKTITIWRNPKANVAVTPASICNNKTFSFADTLNNSSVVISSYVWNFGDGQTSADIRPTHVYETFGSKTVRLALTTDHGCQDSANQIVKTNQTVAAFDFTSASAQCTRGNKFVFNNTSFTESPALNYSWNFGDGQNSTDANPAHSFATAGNYTIRLIAKVAGMECSDTITKSAIVYINPTAAFNINNSELCNSKTFGLTNTSVSGNTYNWIFGDGTSSADVNVNHTYANYGSNTVKLIAVSTFGCSDTASKIVNSTQTIASFAAVTPTQCFKNNLFSFINNSSTTNGSLTYSWLLGNDSRSSVTNPTKSFSTTGSYNIRLIAASSNGCKDTLDQTVTVYPNADNVNFSSHLSNYTRSSITVNFENETEISSGSLSYNWNFGDGQNSISKNPTHVYTTDASTRTVKLITTSNKGCMDTVTRVIALVDGQSHADENNQNNNSSNIAGSNATSIDVYPNPAQNFVQLSVRNTQTSNNNDFYVLTVYDFNGHAVIQRTQPVTAGSASTIFNINVQNLLPGNYFVEVKNSLGVRIATRILVRSR